MVLDQDILSSLYAPHNHCLMHMHLAPTMKSSLLWQTRGCVCTSWNCCWKPMQIYNMDKIGVTVVHKAVKVVRRLDVEMFGLLCTYFRWKRKNPHHPWVCFIIWVCSAPFLIYPRKRITDNLKVGAFDCSDTGWVNTQVFVKWLHFLVESVPPSRPVLLILDGHEVIEFARSNDISMLCIPARTTHILQPVDVGVFKSQL